MVHQLVAMTTYHTHVLILPQQLIQAIIYTEETHTVIAIMPIGHLKLKK